MAARSVASFAVAGLAALALLGPLATAGVAPSAAAFAGTVVPQLSFGPFHAAVGGCGASSLCPVDIRSAYNMTLLDNSSATNGTGQTVVIVDACGDSSIKSDIATFDSTFHLPAVKLRITHLGAGHDCKKTAWSLETALDVEWAHVMAPGARIDLVLPKSGTNAVMYDAWNYSVTNALGDQISDSWGGPGACSPTVKGYLNAAARANVTVLAAAGDGGAWGAGTSSPGFQPADCKRVLTVGGTTLHLNASGGYGSEDGWSSGGGGYSLRSPEPSYEKAVGIPDSYGAMAKPDVAADADPATGVWIYDGSVGGWSSIGGTSVATPLWAGFVADVNELRATNGFAPLGDFHAYLYLHVYGTNGTSANYTAELHDVKKGNNGWPAGKGWDPVTGLGSMNGYPLLQQLGNDPKA